MATLEQARKVKELIRETVDEIFSVGITGNETKGYGVVIVYDTEDLVIDGVPITLKKKNPIKKREKS